MAFATLSKKQFEVERGGQQVVVNSREVIPMGQESTVTTGAFINNFLEGSEFANSTNIGRGG